MANVKLDHDKTVIRFIVFTDDGEEPWLCSLRFVDTSPHGNNWRFETLNARRRKVISTYHETPPPDTVDEAIRRYQMHQMAYARICRSQFELNKVLQRILAAERLRGSKVGPDSGSEPA